MMSKRRQTIGFQIVVALALLGLVAYLFVPSTRTLRLSDNWYSDSELAQPEPQPKLANVKQQIIQEEEDEVEAAPAPPPPAPKKKKKVKNIAPPPVVEEEEEVVIKADRVKAAFVILARNSELNGVRASMQAIEDRFNRKFNYPYVFLNNEPFSDEFKRKVQAMTKGKVEFGRVTEEMWGYPDHIDQEKAAKCREDMHNRRIIYGGSESYRHMCRFQSGFFFRHPAMAKYEYYWRVEPDVQYFCDIDYDVFQMMKDNGKKYGWTLSLTEYMETIPTLWKTTQEFMEENKEYVNWGEESLMPWTTDTSYETYNGCHFWSNFEIGSLEFFRSEKYLKFFNFLDAKGGFFYERWGDAPVHSLAVAMFLKTSEVHFFNDIGYRHNPLMHCPTEPWINNKCSCNEKDNFDHTDWSCLRRYSAIQSDYKWSESQAKNMTKPYRVKNRLGLSF